MNEQSRNTCKTCKFWQPRVYQSGRCGREGFAHSKIWMTKDGEIWTHYTFGCYEHEPLPAEDKETL